MGVWSKILGGVVFFSLLGGSYFYFRTGMPKRFPTSEEAKTEATACKLDSTLVPDEKVFSGQVQDFDSVYVVDKEGFTNQTVFGEQVKKEIKKDPSYVGTAKYWINAEGATQVFVHTIGEMVKTIGGKPLLVTADMEPVIKAQCPDAVFGGNLTEALIKMDPHNQEVSK